MKEFVKNSNWPARFRSRTKFHSTDHGTPRELKRWDKMIWYPWTRGNWCWQADFRPHCEWCTCSNGDNDLMDGLKMVHHINCGICERRSWHNLPPVAGCLTATITTTTTTTQRWLHSYLSYGRTLMAILSTISWGDHGIGINSNDNVPGRWFVQLFKLEPSFARQDFLVDASETHNETIHGCDVYLC